MKRFITVNVFIFQQPQTLIPLSAASTHLSDTLSLVRNRNGITRKQSESANLTKTVHDDAMYVSK